MVIVYEEQLKAGLRFPINPFYSDIVNFYKLSIAQLYPNNWHIVVAFRFICFNNNISSSIALFSQLYQLGTRVNEKNWFFSEKKHHTFRLTPFIS